MADLLILPEAYINRQRVEFRWGKDDKAHLLAAGVAYPGGFASVYATNPERALADLREAVEVAERGVTPEVGQNGEHT